MEFSSLLMAAGGCRWLPDGMMGRGMSWRRREAKAGRKTQATSTSNCAHHRFVLWGLHNSTQEQKASEECNLHLELLF